MIFWESSAAANAVSAGPRVIRLRAAAAFAAVPPQQAVDDCGGAADTGLHIHRACRTVSAAGATLHAGVTVDNLRALPVHLKYIVGADIQAHAAAVTF